MAKKENTAKAVKVTRQPRYFTNGTEIVKARNIESALNKIAREYALINEDSDYRFDYGKEFSAINKAVSREGFKDHWNAVAKKFGTDVTEVFGMPAVVLKEEDGIVYFLCFDCGEIYDVNRFCMANCTKEDFLDECGFSSTAVDYTDDPKAFAHNVLISLNRAVKNCRKNEQRKPAVKEIPEAEPAFIFGDTFCCEAKSLRQAERIFVDMVDQEDVYELLDDYDKGKIEVEEVDEDIIEFLASDAIYDLAIRYDSPYTNHPSKHDRSVNLSEYVSDELFDRYGIEEEEVEVSVRFDDGMSYGMYSMYFEAIGESGHWRKGIPFLKDGEYDDDLFLNAAEEAIEKFIDAEYDEYNG